MVANIRHTIEPGGTRKPYEVRHRFGAKTPGENLVERRSNRDDAQRTAIGSQRDPLSAEDKLR